MNSLYFNWHFEQMYRIQFDNYKRTSFCSTFVLIRVFVALASSYQFFFDFLVSLVSLIVSLTVFVTYSSYSIQSAEDCKSRFSLTAKNMFWLNLTTFFHLCFFVLQKKSPKIYISQGYHYVNVSYNCVVSNN